MMKFDRRTAANLEVAPETVCQKLPNGGNHETRKRVAEALLRAAESGHRNFLRPVRTLAPRRRLSPTGARSVSDDAVAAPWGRDPVRRQGSRVGGSPETVRER